MAAISLTGAIGRNTRASVATLDLLAPGGVLQWTVSGSGFGGIADLRLRDELGDGQRMNSFRPQVALRRGGGTIFEGDLVGWTGVRAADSATTTIEFDLAPTFRAANLPAGVTDDTTIAVTFRSTIQASYAARVAPPNGRAVGQGDTLRNAAHFTGTAAGNVRSSDAVAAQAALPTGALVTSVYAVNGVVGATAAVVGDIVTYRMALSLPLGAARQVQIVASAPGIAGPFVLDVPGVAAPPDHHLRFGPAGTAQPTLTQAAEGPDTLRLDLGDVQAAAGPAVVDVLLSVALTDADEPVFQASVSEANAFGAVAAAAPPPLTVVVLEPRLTLQVATLYASNDNATWTGTGGPQGFDPWFSQFGDIVSSAGIDGEAFDDRLSGIDAGDEVTFVIAVQNRGGAAAHDVAVSATLPEGFLVPDDSWLTVIDGAGRPVAVSNDLFDPVRGLVVDGALAPYDPHGGLNVLLVTYTLRTSDRLEAGGPVRGSTASIVRYASQPGAANQADAAPAAARTEVLAIAPAVTILLTGSDLPATAGSSLALGELVTFEVAATLPEGSSPGLRLGALLPAGFEAVSARVIGIGAGITTAAPVVDGPGIVFGDAVNTPDGLDNEADRLRIEVKARPIQASPGPAPHPAVVWGIVSLRSGFEETASAPVTVGAPVSPVAAMSLTSGPPANGAVATFRITVTLPPGLSSGLRLLDSLPPGLEYLPGSVRVVQAGGLVSDGAPTLTEPAVRWDGRLLTLDFGRVQAPAAAARQLVVEVQARVGGAAVGAALAGSVVAETGYAASAPVTAGGVVVNTAPAVTGMPALQAGRDDTVAAPFGGIGLTDPDDLQTITARVTIGQPANGTLIHTGGGTYDAAAGVYAITGRTAGVAVALAGLRFVPVRGQGTAGQRTDTDLTMTVQDGAGGIATATTRLGIVQANVAPIIRNAAPCQEVLPGGSVQPFTGLLLLDPDAGQVATLTIALSDPSSGVLTGAGPGRYDAAAGVFTSIGTNTALMAEAGRLRFTAHAGAPARTVDVAIAIDDGAGGMARDTATIELSAANIGAPVPSDPVAALFIGAVPTTVVTVTPAMGSVLNGTGGRDAYFMDGAAGTPQWAAVTGFGGGDLMVLWGFRAGRSSYVWSDDGMAGEPGRTIEVDVPNRAGATARLTFAGLTAADTDRFAISGGRVGGLDYLAIEAR